MKRRVIAIALILANTLSLASCSLSDNPSLGGSSRRDDDDGKDPSHAQEEVLDIVKDISESLVKCDAETLRKCCITAPESVLEIMPYVEEDDGSDNYKKPDNHLVVRNMIASTIKYEIDEDSFKAKKLGSTCDVDVTYSFKDYKQAASMRETFVNPGDFNSMLYEVTDTIEKTVTLEFKKTHGKYLLTNGDDLACVYEYEVDDLNFMRSLFDMVDDMYMTGEGWDPVTESYTDTNTFEIVLVLNDQAKDYIWQYVYRVVEETYPKWRNIYQSSTITDKYPTEIHITYTQDENFTEGFYAILFYNYYDDTIIGMEFDVFESKPDDPETSETSESSETSETT